MDFCLSAAVSVPLPRVVNMMVDAAVVRVDESGALDGVQ